MILQYWFTFVIFCSKSVQMEVVEGEYFIIIAYF